MGKVLDRLGERSRRASGRSGKTVAIPSHLEWLEWRLVAKQVATLSELRSFYDLVDVLDAHTTLDILDEVESLRHSA